MDRENSRDHVAAEVRATLARRRISGKDLAVALGLSPFAISRRLRGEKEFSVGELLAVARFLGVPLSELLPNDEPVSA